MTQEKASVRSWMGVLLASAMGFFVLIVLSSLFLFSPRSVWLGKSRNVWGSFFSSSSHGAVGVVEIQGVLLDSKETLSQLEHFEEEPMIRAIVLRLNSPGGATAPAQEIYEAVKRYKKPVVVSMSSVAASGAYYIAAAAQKIFANPGTLTGSIGVIMEFVNLEKLYAWAKVDRYVVKSGRHKDMGSEFRALTDQERLLLQQTSDDVLEQFKKAVCEGRRLTMEQVAPLATGRVFSGQQAQTLHLVDQLGSIQDAILEAGVLGGISGKPVVVFAQKLRPSWLERIFDSESPQTEWKGWVGLFASLLWPSIGSTAVPAPISLPSGIYLLWRGGL